VFPLAAKSKWLFDTYPHKTKAVFLMTDGVWNKVVPPLLEGQEYELDHAYLKFLYNNLSQMPERNCRDWIENELACMNPGEINNDDKTLIVAICENVKFTPHKNGEEYYRYPKSELWQSLIRKQQDELYPYRGEEKPRSKPQKKPPPKPIQQQPYTVSRVSKQHGRAGTILKIILMLMLIIALGFFIVAESHNEKNPEETGAAVLKTETTTAETTAGASTEETGDTTEHFPTLTITAVTPVPPVITTRAPAAQWTPAPATPTETTTELQQETNETEAETAAPTAAETAAAETEEQ